MSRLFPFFATTPPQASPGPLLRKLLDAAQAIAAREVDLFRFLLGEALLKLSETTSVPAEEQASFDAYNHLRKGGDKFCAAFLCALNHSSSAALRALEDRREEAPPLLAADIDSAQDRLRLDELAQTLEKQAGDSLLALECSLAKLLGREALARSQNPWCVQNFLNALYQAWRTLDAEPQSRRVMLGLIGPKLFLRLDAIYAGLNAVLAEAGVAPDAKAIARARRAVTPVAPTQSTPLPFAATTSPAIRLRDERYYRVRDWLLAGSRGGKHEPAEEAAHLNLPDLFAEPDESGQLQANTISVPVPPRLYSHLTRLQQKLEQTLRNATPQGSDILRHIGRGLPPGVLSPVDANTLDLMERVFEHLLQSPDTADFVKPLLVRLQIPVLKVALMDRKFFINGTHPAHRLLDLVLICSAGWDEAQSEEDRLRLALERAVDRIAAEFDQTLQLFTEVNAELEALLQQEASQAEAAIQPCLPQALRAERLHLAERAARADIALRLEAGTVPYALENFVQAQWMRVLTLAHAGQRKKPELLPAALATLDDLLWSLQAKADAAERKLLLQRLPGILSRMNAWLDAIKWHAPERAQFFTDLAAQHARLVRLPREEANARMETALDQARRASERGMLGARRKPLPGAARADSPADQLVLGDWLELQQQDGARRVMRLAWVSPQRSQFVLASRGGGASLIIPELELERRLQAGQARVMKVEGAVNRALDAVLAGRDRDAA